MKKAKFYIGGLILLMGLSVALSGCIPKQENEDQDDNIKQQQSSVSDQKNDEHEDKLENEQEEKQEKD